MSNSTLDRKLKQCAMLCSFTNLALHFSEFIAFIPIKFSGQLACLWLILSWILPWKFWHINRHAHPFIDESAKNALNFTLSISLYLTIFVPILFYSYGISIGAALKKLDSDRAVPKSIELDIASIVSQYGSYFVFALLIFHFLTIVFGSVRVAKGNIYRYPLAIPFFR